MKKICLFLFICIFSTQSLAAENSLLKSILHEMTKEYLKEVGKTKAYEFLANKAGEKLASNLSDRVAQGTAILGLANSINDYQNGESETQKYHALTQGVANFISLLSPKIGGYVQMGAMGQQFASALVQKKYSIEITQLIAEIAAIEKKSAALIMAEAQAEEQLITVLANRSEAIDALTKENLKILEQRCSLPGEKKPKEIQLCLEHIYLHLKLARAQERTLLQILTFNGRFFTGSRLPEPMLTSTKKSYEQAVVDINKQTMEINRLIFSFTESVVSASKQEALKRSYFYECDRLIHSSLKDIFETKRQILTDDDKDGFAELSLPDFQFDLKNLTEGRCKLSLPELSPEIQNLIVTAVE